MPRQHGTLAFILATSLSQSFRKRFTVVRCMRVVGHDERLPGLPGLPGKLWPIPVDLLLTEMKHGMSMPVAWVKFVTQDPRASRRIVRALFSHVRSGGLLLDDSDETPSKSQEPTAVGAFCSAVAGHVTGRRCLSFGKFGGITRMRRIASFILLCGVGFVCGCSAIGSRVVGDRYFSGVRCDYAMVFERSSIDPSSRVHPVLAVVDTPFFFVGDILFLPYDVYEGCDSSPITNAVASSSHD